MKYLLIVFIGFTLIYSCSPDVVELVPLEGTTELVDSRVAAGKLIWENDCTLCHYEQKIITDYSMDKWQEILPNMIANAKLDEEKSEQIRLYVYWVLENQ